MWALDEGMEAPVGTEARTTHSPSRNTLPWCSWMGRASGDATSGLCGCGGTSCILGIPSHHVEGIKRASYVPTIYTLEEVLAMDSVAPKVPNCVATPTCALIPSPPRTPKTPTLTTHTRDGMMQCETPCGKASMTTRSHSRTLGVDLCDTSCRPRTRARLK